MAAALPNILIGNARLAIVGLSKIGMADITASKLPLPPFAPAAIQGQKVQQVRSIAKKQPLIILVM